MSDDPLYQQAIALARQLTLEQKLDLMLELVRMLRYPDQMEPKHDIMEFRGVAKDLWKDIDVEKYIQEERDSWDR